MKKNRIKKIILVIASISIVLGTGVVFSEPGSENDPLVSLSYLDKRMAQLKDYIDGKLHEIGNKSEKSTNQMILK